VRVVVYVAALMLAAAAGAALALAVHRVADPIVDRLCGGHQ